MLPPLFTPERAKANPLFSVILGLCDAMYYKPAELAEHWRMTDGHLSNMRRAQKGPGYIKLPSGAILYPLSEILAWEFAGRDGGPVTLERLELALATMRGLSETDRAAIMSHLREAFTPMARARR